MDELVFKIENIVRQCGNEILLANQSELEIENKEGIGNIVTQYDIKIQKELKESLLSLLPNANFVGEEEDMSYRSEEKEYTFVVDPIDGTTNFSRNLSLSAISVALLKKGEPYIGVCYNPYTNELYTAQKGKGAYLNSSPISVSKKTLKEGLVLAGSAAYYMDIRQQFLELLTKVALVSADYRRFGSAVIELCSIAAGKAELYFELKLQPWDFAAAALIVEEAGGKVSQINGAKLSFDAPTSVIASNGVEDYLKYLI